MHDGIFHFKRFSVSHKQSTHKVGTDAVLLGAWVDVDSAKRILDVGAGTGVISLMLAQRTENPVTIDAVEIEKTDVTEARQNVQCSLWPDRITVHHGAIQDFNPSKRFHLLVSNPPFFRNSLLPPDKKRTQARHTQELSFEDLLATACRLLQPSGRLALILPFREGREFNALAKGKGLYCIRECAFRSRQNNPVERLLMEFSFRDAGTATETLTLYGEGHAWSSEYRKLTADFYLNA